MPRKGTRKGARRGGAADKARDVPFRDVDGQSYAVVTAMLGNGRLRARCEDTVERMCKIRGSMRRSDWISVGDVILVGLRGFQDAKADVLHRYPQEDVRHLRKMGELVSVTTVFDDGERVEIEEEDFIAFEDEDVESLHWTSA